MNAVHLYSDQDFARRHLAKGDKFRIVPKRDFGQYGWYDSETRTNIRTGFVVVIGHCNVMPGATWFRTIEQAMHGIKVLMETENSDQFWALLRFDKIHS